MSVEVSIGEAVVSAEHGELAQSHDVALVLDSLKGRVLALNVLLPALLVVYVH